MLSVLQEAQQSQSVHSHFEHRRAKTGQFSSTLDTAVREVNKHLSETTVKERWSEWTVWSGSHCLSFVSDSHFFFLWVVSVLVVVLSGVWSE